MVVNIAKILLQSGAELRHPATEKPCRCIEQWFGGVLNNHELSFHLVEILDIHARRLIGEDALFDVFQLRLKGVKHRKITIHHRVHESIEDVSRTMAQQLRFLLSPVSHIGKSARRTAAHGQDIIPADEYRQLTDGELAVGGLNYLQNHKKRLSVLFDLGALMSVAGVFHS